MIYSQKKEIDTSSFFSGGPDPIEQQIFELDEQSRIMCGLNSSSNGDSSDDHISKSHIIIHSNHRPQIM